MKESNSREFQLWVVLSVISGRAIYDENKYGVMGLWEFVDHMLPLLGFMTGEPAWNHDAKRLADEVTPYIYEQNPQLKEISFDDAHSSLSELESQYGEMVTLHPIHQEDHVSLPPEVTLRMAGFKGEVVYLDDEDNES